MALFHRVLVWLLFFSVLSFATSGHGDIIYLKDGTIEESERVWRSQEYVHFILKGTKGVVIRYANKIVDRVVIGGVEEKVAVESHTVKPKRKLEDSPKEMVKGNENSTLKATSQLRRQNQLAVVDPKIINAHRGVSFYDPRRAQRYWAAKNSRHRTLSGAMNALAQIYGQPVQWIEAYMGTENDLGVIHQNLMLNQGKALAPNVEPAASAPRPDSIQKKVEPALPTKLEQTTGITSRPAADSTTKGIVFYNPRRKKKYWTGNAHRYDSLNRALEALAQQYGVTVEWVERYMGNTNDLDLIHKNIQESLE